MAAKKCLMKRVHTTEKTFEMVYEEFIISRKVQNVRPATLEYYRWHLKVFRDYLKEQGFKFFEDLKKPDFDKFVLWLQERYENSVTVNTYLRATRAFLNYAIGLNYLEPFGIKLIKQDKVIKETYTDGEIKKLIQKPDLKRCNFSEYRNWVLVQYLLETGNRLNTVINIKVGDIDLEAGMAVLKTTKNRNPMFSPLGQALIKVLSEYIREWELNSDDFLFPNVERKQMTKNAIQNTIAKYNKSREVEKTSIHSFRHTFAKRYVMKGGNAFKLQRLLGHSSLAITEQYIALFSNDLAEDFDKYSTIDEFCSSYRMTRKS